MISAATNVALDEQERNYHDTTAAYALPNDNVEHRRLEQQHTALLGVMGGKISHAPLKCSISKALDVGCGTGAAAHAIASSHPTAVVYGIDLSPIPEYLRPKLSNLEFIQGDFNEMTNQNASNAAFAPRSLDFVFSRLLTFGVTDWPTYISRAKSILKPGGWLELQEVDYHYYRAPLDPDPDPSVYDAHDLDFTSLQSQLEAHPSNALRSTPLWVKTLNALLAAKSLEPYAGSKVAMQMQQAGFTDIRIRRYISPTGVWDGLTPEQKVFGNYVAEQVPLVYPAVMRKLAKETGYDEKEVELSIDDLEREFEGEDGARMWWWVWSVCGKKPDEEAR
ncbi:S-adenosyl-L-methionine-dependent methyltransferase [Polyplosphaeria fusca]|uniref:S-adenosyl-L-methionine-dependent methyltransferase n=1 Tax=Polyplosphaeria fusca TaxID=682080 RepID=A0A9P4V7P6_9PLEO|nr:S-adenosyl-L-methionine-dependent methyltransferase [Polyplosphaeria fusca]